MDKKNIRDQLKNSKLLEKNKIHNDHLINLKLYLILKESRNKLIAVYYPTENEVNIKKFIAWWKENLALPKIISADLIEFHLWEKNLELEQSKFFSKILQPKNINLVVPDIVILPCLACSYEGYRVGSGKGMYDKYLNHNAKKYKIYTIGLCYQSSMIKNFNVEPHDYKLDAVITEKEIYLFKKE